MSSIRTSPDPATADGPAGSSTLNRALEVLEALAEDGNGGATASTIAAHTGVNRVTVHRILNTFKAFGLVRQDGAGAPYKLGFRFVELGELVLDELDLARLGQPVLERLAEETGETAHLAILDGAELVYVAKAESSHAVRLVSRIGLRAPLYCTSLGKALLAAGPPGADSLVDAQLFVPRTDRTHRDADSLRSDLVAIRRRGFAIDHGENENGVHCVAAAVVDHAGAPIGALSISGPDSRIPEERFEEFGILVAKHAREVSEAFGAAPP